MLGPTALNLERGRIDVVFDKVSTERSKLFFKFKIILLYEQFYFFEFHAWIYSFKLKKEDASV